MASSMSSRLVIVIVLFIYVIEITSANEIIVNTSLGKIEGKQVSSIIPNEVYYSFLDIPYAQAPVEELRFMAPKPHPGWEGVLNVKKERKGCAQYFLPTRSTKKYGFNGDEDCLNLSIHTPKLPNNDNPDLPVIVFLLNENFRLTYNVTRDYLPDFFMKEDVIIVTINHRIGSLGFLSFEDDLLPGNNGLRDVILGLNWLKENARNFGGNPDKITLMGNQGGAVVVDLLLYSPKAKGLFSAAILQSGTAWNSMYFNGEGRKRAKELAEQLELISGTSESLLRDLSRITAMDITESELKCVHSDLSRSLQKGVPAFIPVVEHEHPDAVLTKLPEESNLDIDIPIMIGYNSRESIELCERFLKKPQYLTFAERDFLLVFPIRTGYHFKINDKVYNEAVQEIKDFYFDEGYVKTGKPGEYITYIQDSLQFYAIDYAVRKYVNESKAPVFYYTFDYSGEFNLRKKQILEDALNPDGTWGASLADELCYLFICRPIKKLYTNALKDPEENEELKVLINMVRMWTNFAKTGNPTPSGEEFTWTPATKDNKDCLLINEELEMKVNLHEDRVKFWDDFIGKYKEKAVNGVVQDIHDEL